MTMRYCRDTQQQIIAQVLRGLNEVLNGSGFGEISIVIHDKTTVRVAVNDKGTSFQGVLDKTMSHT